MAKRKMISAETAMDTSQVLARRMPMLAMTLLDPTPARRAEATRMIVEKQQAVVAGIFGAQMALWRAWLGGSLDLARTGSDVIDAAHGPALKTLRSNARRLSKRKTL